ncbi:hypothetical protein GGR55DRAFT_251497 [Xylaria sp. FL0064]|nr:hypothetical protein GGR55DRAFT_251497 [Xylaria sp. FL0064]
MRPPVLHHSKLRKTSRERAVLLYLLRRLSHSALLCTGIPNHIHTDHTDGTDLTLVRWLYRDLDTEERRRQILPRSWEKRQCDPAAAHRYAQCDTCRQPSHYGMIEHERGIMWVWTAIWAVEPYVHILSCHRQICWGTRSQTISCATIPCLVRSVQGKIRNVEGVRPEHTAR